MSEEKSRLMSVKDSLISSLETAVVGNLEKVNPTDLAVITDAIKDLAEAEMYCYQAKYYEAVAEAMEESEGEDHEEPMYYRPNRRMGYDSTVGPYLTNRWRLDDTNYDDNHISQDRDASKYGRAFSEYRKAKRNYTETKSEESRTDMNSMAMRHLNNAISSIREMWDGADESLKVTIKNDIVKMVNEMTM